MRRAPALAILLLLAGAAMAAAPVVVLEAVEEAPGGDARHVGQPIPLRVRVELPAGVRLLDAPTASAPQEELFLRTVGEATGEARAGGGSVREYRMELVPLQLGEVEFPGVTVSWADEDGKQGTAASGPLALDVVAAIDDPMTAEPADIRGPASVPVPPRYVVWILLAALLLAVGLAAWWWRRRGRRPAEVAPAPPVDPFRGLGPAGWAQEELQRLQRDDVLGRQGALAYHVRLAEIVRLYLGGQFRIPTLERTTRELLQDAEAALRPLPGTRERLRHVLSSCDLVKFARLQPPVEESLDLARTAAQVVEETRPQPAAAGTAAEAG